MNQEVTALIESLNSPWKIETYNQLRQMVYQSLPDVEERMQYRKPHYLINGHYAAVISPSKDAITFTIFNTTNVELPIDQFEGPVERKSIKIRDGHATDYNWLAKFLVQAASSL
ncbi:DUF1801 domain-containing protein [Cohnella abietis]|uniref:YdhG-like domain-containing protein n=1 Tax=Cohnella abietis TaxID=2507935 RepID=A0A3T1D6T4_9BACL|nr:DUF1801 domain-containing protein [Cohnella abietis]BBI33798.1 hypothetical protein KCTCHS21_31970 [Cohnella abietis]